jgi:hypothetical protein
MTNKTLFLSLTCFKFNYNINVKFASYLYKKQIRNFKNSSVNLGLTNKERNNFKLTKLQKDILIGLCLGDIRISKGNNHKNTRLIF